MGTAMSVTQGLDFVEDGDDFLLCVTGRDGQITRVRLTEEQVMTLSQSAPVFRDRIALRRSPAGKDVSAVVVTPVSHIGIQPDSLGTAILLTLQSSTRGRLTFAIDPRGAQLILEKLPGELEKIVSGNPTKQ